MNRLLALVRSQEIGESVNEWPIRIEEIDSEIDDYLIERIDTITQQHLDFEEILYYIATIFHESLAHLAENPKCPRTRQNRWAVILARILPIEIALRFEYEMGIKRSTKVHNTLARSIRDLRSDRQLETVMPPGIYYNLMDRIDQNIEPYIY